MPTFNSNGVEIAYELEGEGEPILLIHGFASNARVNWRDTGWIATLVEAGCQVIAIDNRGHGQSAKLYDLAAYGAPTMAEDARRLLDHLALPNADVMGYSMGARIAAFLAINHPTRVRSAILAGLAENLVRGVGRAEQVARALEAESADQVGEPGPRAFRLFAEATGSDLRALAACMRASRERVEAAKLSHLSLPVLIAVGTKDDIAGPPEPLAKLIPGSEILHIPGRDHMRAVGDKVYKAGVLDFLSRLKAKS